MPLPSRASPTPPGSRPLPLPAILALLVGGFLAVCLGTAAVLFLVDPERARHTAALPSPSPTAVEQATGPTPTELPTAVPSATPLPTPVLPTATLPTPPTRTPAPTRTPLPSATASATPTVLQPSLPVIEFFRANPSTIVLGECSQLEWGKVINASAATIDHGIGGVGTPGSALVCPTETTTYTLTATGPTGDLSATTQVTVQGAQPGQVTVTLLSQADLDGYVIRGRDALTGREIRVGNRGTESGERLFRGFLSFDLSTLPRGAVVQSARLRFFQATIWGDPYGKLGPLQLKHVNYGLDLTTAAFDGPDLGSTILPSLTSPNQWHTVTGRRLARWIEQDLADGRLLFQARLQFAVDSDADDAADYLQLESGDNSLGTGNVPELSVTYLP